MRDAEPRVLVVAPDGRGGVSSAIEAVMPEIPGAWRIPVRPLGLAASTIALQGADVVWLHPSLRRRALARDAVLGAVAAARGRRVVVQVHGWDPALARDPRFPGWLGGLAAPRVAAWGVLSGAHADALVGWGVPARHIHRVANAYRPEVVPDDRAPADPPTVLFVGRMDDDKGAALLLEAVRDLPGVRVRFAGDGPARPALVHATVRWHLDERVEVCGWLSAPALRRSYAMASAVVLPSASETFPLAVVEALAAGVPVVATAVGEVPELVGEGGLLVRRDPAALAAALREILAAPPPMEATRARIRARCAPAAVGAQWRDIFAGIV